MGANNFTSINTTQKIQIFIKNVLSPHLVDTDTECRHKYSRQTLLLLIVFICRSICLLVFSSSDLFLLNTWGCNYFFLAEI